MMIRCFDELQGDQRPCGVSIATKEWRPQVEQVTTRLCVTPGLERPTMMSRMGMAPAARASRGCGRVGPRPSGASPADPWRLCPLC
jgi:hypothetical protein